MTELPPGRGYDPATNTWRVLTPLPGAMALPQWAGTAVVGYGTDGKLRWRSTTSRHECGDVGSDLSPASITTHNTVPANPAATQWNEPLQTRGGSGIDGNRSGDCRPSVDVRWLRIVGLDGGSAIVALEDALRDEVLLADSLDGEHLTLVHGAPMRFTSPAQDAYKSAKHVVRIELSVEQPGVGWSCGSAGSWASPGRAGLRRGGPSRRRRGTRCLRRARLGLRPGPGVRTC